MRIEQDRIPLISEEYKQNQFYGWYEDIFRSYQLGADAIVFVGDSMVSVPDWNVLLNAEGCHVHNFGIPGDTLAGVLNRIDTVLRSKPRAIVIWVGINDVIKGRTATEFQNDLDQLQKALGDYSGYLIVLEILPVTLLVVDAEFVNGRVSGFNQRLARFASVADAIYIEHDYAYDSSSFVRTDLSRDGIHLNENGYRLVSDKLSVVIQESVCPKD